MMEQGARIATKPVQEDTIAAGEDCLSDSDKSIHYVQTASLKAEYDLLTMYTTSNLSKKDLN